MLSAEEMRRSYLLDALFVPNTIPLVYSDIDRSITGTAVPQSSRLALRGSKQEMATEQFAERREIGIINIGSAGKVLVDGKTYELGPRDGLYVGRGAADISFESAKASEPAKFYFVSYPAHAAYPTTRILRSEAEASTLGAQATANARTIFKYIHPNGVKSCQLVMGLTALEEGSVWNTMPPHTHQRRSEVYMYFDLDPDAMVVHLVGVPEATRHLIMRNEQAVLNPSWSIHAGVGTRRYSFIWAMGGENQTFDDMDSAPVRTLR
jgi:4-deoxy-L-threo-5-hexosulose-uronate ketol-isomerase